MIKGFMGITFGIYYFLDSSLIHSWSIDEVPGEAWYSKSNTLPSKMPMRPFPCVHSHTFRRMAPEIDLNQQRHSRLIAEWPMFLRGGN